MNGILKTNVERFKSHSIYFYFISQVQYIPKLSQQSNIFFSFHKNDQFRIFCGISPQKRIKRTYVRV